jgi:uncharacterized protein (TIGR03437 family)
LLTHPAQKKTLLNRDRQEEALSMPLCSTLNSPANPAKVGSVIWIFGTGGDFVLASATIPGRKLWPTNPLTFFSSPVIAYFDDAVGEVLFGGSAPGLVNGVFQINARVPAVASNVTIQFSTGQTSVPVPIFVE